MEAVATSRASHTSLQVISYLSSSFKSLLLNIEVMSFEKLGVGILIVLRVKHIKLLVALIGIRNGLLGAIITGN
jgi:hypothetical protein